MKYFEYERPVVTPVIHVEDIDFDRLKSLHEEFKQKAFVNNKLDLLILLHKLSVKNHIRGSSLLDPYSGFTYSIQSIDIKKNIKLNSRNTINKLSRSAINIPLLIYIRVTNSSNGFRWTFRIAKRKEI